MFQPNTPIVPFNPNGIVIYRGPSQLDGAPIIVIATGFTRGSQNGKTGRLIQTWILREDIGPIDAANSGADASICGDCPHRGRIENGRNVARSCYVTLFQAPLNVWDSYHRGIYREAEACELAKLFTGRTLRIGSYGDPAAVPVAIWQAATARAAGWTGYTHQWRIADPALALFCMASCDSSADREAAKLAGWRTFRVRGACEPIEAREVICPASKEAGYKTTCASCQACGGIGAKAKADIVIAAHGAAGKINAFNASRMVA